MRLQHFFSFFVLSICLIFALALPAQSDSTHVDTTSVARTSVDDFAINLSPPAPTAAGLGKYGDIPVSYHTGVPNISVPIYTIEEGTLSLPITMSYHSSGVKVDELASWVGLGWSLNAGGMISRSEVGAKDEGNDNKNDACCYCANPTVCSEVDAISTWGWYKDGGMPSVLSDVSCDANIDNSFTVCKGGHLLAAVGDIDLEPDMFNFNFNGYSGKFYFDESGTPILNPTQDVRIEPVNTPNFFHSWKITVADGTKYYFGGVNATERGYSDGQSGITNNSNNEVTTTWYLTRVESANDAFAIDLTYTAEEYAFKNRGAHTVEAIFCGGNTTLSGSPNNAPTTLNTTFIEGYRLNGITTSSGKTTVDFNADIIRCDVLGAFGSELACGTTSTDQSKPRRLDEIHIQEGTTFQKFYDFTYDHFNSPQNSAEPNYTQTTDTRRLKLLSIQERANTGETIPSHEFTYDESQTMARRLSLGRDHWGYYNGFDTNSGLLPDGVHSVLNQSVTWTTGNNRDPVEQKMKAWILTQIKYPTGGTTDFEYEAHRENPTAPMVGGLRIKTMTQNDAIGGTPIITNYSYPLGILYLGAYSEAYYETFATNLGANNANKYLLSSNIHVPQKQTQGYHIGYSLVEVENSLTGKSLYQYYNLYPTPPSSFGSYPYRPTSYSIGTGELFKETHKDNSGNDIRKVQYDYDTPDEIRVSTRRVGLSSNQSSCGGGSNSFFLVFNNYDLVTSRHLLTKKTEIVDGVETITEYQYADNHNFPIEEKVTNSDDTQYITRTQYPKDYNTTFVTSTEALAIKGLQDRFIINPPVETSSYIKKRNRIEQFTSAILTEYKKDALDFPYPHKKWRTEQRVPIPANDFTPSVIGGGVFTKDAMNYLCHDIHEEQLTFNAYSEQGNLLEYQLTHDEANAFVWTYDQNRLTAEVQNAKQEEVAFTDFERINGFPTSDGGGWDFAQGFVFSNGGKRGTNGYAVSSGTSSIKSTNTNLPAQKYILSFWLKQDSAFPSSSAAVNINTATGGIVFTATVPSTVDEWEWHEYILDNPVSIELVGTGGFPIVSSLRLHPQDAMMKSYSYDQNTRKLIAIADENNVHTYYEYDAFNRMSIIRDFEDNILQTVEYEYYTNPSIPYNHIYTQQTLEAQTNLATVNGYSITAGQVRRSFQFMDGLGRNVQNTNIQASAEQNDVISFMDYDGAGRVDKSYLPYTYPTGTNYHTNAVTEQQGFFTGLINNTFNIEHGLYGGDQNFAYTKNVYETSPLSRVSQEKRAGAAWSGKSMQHIYRSNLATEQVHDFQRGHTNADHYLDDELSVVQTFDEDFHLSRSFTDKLGRVIMVEKEVGGGQYTRTYTIYDDYGNIRAIIPPQVADDMRTDNNWNIHRIKYFRRIYGYNFDERQRAREKYVPGGGTTLFHHNKRDLPVMVTDDNERQTITKYDILKRPVITGEYTGTLLPETDASAMEYETYVMSGLPTYSISNSFPTDVAEGTNFYTYQNNYYDERFTSYFNAPPANTNYETSPSKWTRNKMTGVQKYILDESTYTNGSVVDLSFYDDRSRIIQSGKSNHLGGNDIVFNQYNFVGWLITSQHDHTINIGASHDYTIKDSLVYDHTGRITQVHKQTIDNLDPANYTSPQIFMVNNAYDERDFLSQKRLHRTASNILKTGYLQFVDYNYNINSWLTDINNVNYVQCNTSDSRTDLSEGMQQSDLFSMRLSYNNPENSAVSGLFNGNISDWSWRTGCSDDEHAYGFTYDNINRLKTATYGQDISGSFSVLNDYNVSNIQYDLDGNILALTRAGAISGVSMPTMDDLVYDYHPIIPNHLMKVQENGVLSSGFSTSPVKNSLTETYLYDDVGNLVEDKHKEFTVTYNHLNLPEEVNFIAGAIDWTYLGDGTKITKKSGTDTRQYCGGFEYKNGQLEAIYHPEGRIVKSGGNWQFQYHLKDHLGNVRVTFADTDGNFEAEILQEQAYYPFGMEIGDLSMSNFATPDAYKYNGKELNEEFGLNWYCYGFRMYDPAIGRFPSVDPIADKFAFVSPFNYAENTPINAIDLHGLQAVFVHGTWGNTSHWGTSAKQEVTKATNNEISTAQDFPWSGNNNTVSRDLAASTLADQVLETYYDSSEPLTLVGHSHGGNVAIEAANILYHDFGIKVDNLITVNTPNNGDVKLKGELADIMKSEKRHINISAVGDLIQTIGGNQINKDNSSTIIESVDHGKKPGSGEVGLAGNKFNSAVNIKYTDQIPLLNRSGCGFSNHCGTSISNVKLWSKEVKNTVEKRPN